MVDSAGHRLLLAVVCVAVVAIAACGGGVGDVGGVTVIGQRDDPNAGATGGSARSSGSSAPAGLDCAGRYTCTQGTNDIKADLDNVGGRCQADYNGTTVVLQSDGSITVDGTKFGTWRLSGSSIDVCTVDGQCATCVKNSSAGADAGPSTRKGLGEGPCTTDAECQSDACAPAGFCSVRCSGDAGTLCGVPPFDGTCSTQGFCNKS